MNTSVEEHPSSTPLGPRGLLLSYLKDQLSSTSPVCSSTAPVMAHSYSETGTSVVSETLLFFLIGRFYPRQVHGNFPQRDAVAQLESASLFFPFPFSHAAILANTLPEHSKKSRNSLINDAVRREYSRKLFSKFQIFLLGKKNGCNILSYADE
ncbi:hypothetical protein CEXT_477121 [Caerostris extrusa]|uniref:Maturase K n=1 Tax=Caerostris extrusa TaxID=172846 RepID=A0AAV4VND9_CAEEX|nr:hypothetical protein CEXT_477121 [Caerostris extrusa]